LTFVTAWNESDDPRGAPELRALLHQVGVTDDQIDAVNSRDELIELAGVAGIGLGPERLSLEQLAAAAGITTEQARMIAMAAGVADDHAAPQWFTSDVGWFAASAAAFPVLGEEAVLALIRRAGVAMNQLAHASAAAFRVNALANREAEDLLAVLRRNLSVGSLIDVYVEACSQLFRHSALGTIRADVVAAGAYGELRDIAVGFVDVASSTELAQRVDPAELAALVADFDRASLGAATRHGARVVKTIGDEVMLAADDPAAVCGAALDLVAHVHAHERWTEARAGVAYGAVLDQDGDYFGPVVNRAARLVEAAPDGMVMADASSGAALTAAAAAGLVFRPAPTVALRGMAAEQWGQVLRADMGGR
jgi:adenylate cyclase